MKRCLTSANSPKKSNFSPPDSTLRGALRRPFLINRYMSKLKNNPVAKALLQTDRRRTQFVPDKKKPNRNQLKYEDLRLKKEWEEI